MAAGRHDTASRKHALAVEHLAELQTELDELADAAAVQARRAVWLLPMARLAQQVAADTTDNADLHTRLTEAESAHTLAERNQKDALRRAGELQERSTRATTQAERIPEQASEHGVALPDRPQHVPDGTPSLDRLLRELATARQQAADLQPDTDLLARHTDETTKVGQLVELLPDAKDPTRLRAEALADKPDAQTARDRTRAKLAATHASTQAQGRVASTNAACERAQAALDGLPLVQVRRPDGADPETAQEAADLFEQHDTRRRELAEQSERLRAEAAASQTRAAAEQQNADGYTTAIRAATELIETISGHLDATAASSPHPGGLREAERALQSVKKEVVSANSELEAAEELLTSARTAVTMRLADLPSEALPDITRETLHSVLPTVGNSLRGLHRQLVLRHTTLTGQLAELEGDRTRIGADLAREARHVLDTLAALRTNAVMPPSTRTWSGKPFVKAEFDSAVRADLPTCAQRVVGRSLARDQPPDTVDDLLVDILREALPGTGLRIRMLRPSRELDPAYYDLGHMPTSDGQELTAAILLYCVLARLRTRMRDGTATTSPGVLWLDNPFGKANETVLVDLQRQMASKLGIQLIYCTGINDPAALAHLDLWNQLTHRRHRRTGASHVVSDVAEVTGVTISRTAPQRAAFDATTVGQGGPSDA